MIDAIDYCALYPDDVNNFKELFPMHKAILEMPHPEELTVEYWTLNKSFPFLSPGIRYELVKIRQARDRRIQVLIAHFPEEEKMQRHYGYMHKEEQDFWERISHKPVILPEPSS